MSSENMQKRLSITLVRSPIGHSGNQREVLRGLGLTKLRRTVVRSDTPQTLGMIAKVAHLVEVKEAR